VDDCPYEVLDKGKACRKKTMPFKSKAQERYFNANRASLEKQGVNVSEWNSASKGKQLPEKSVYSAAAKRHARNR
jgi:hypothetical protein